MPAAVSAPWARAQNLDESNIYAEDVQRASDALDGAEQRLTDARQHLFDTAARLPAAQRSAARTWRVASSRQAAATTASQRADARETQVRKSRERARAQVAAAKAEHSRRMMQWRAHRAEWIAIASATFALACALIVSVATALGRVVGVRDQHWLADVVGISLGVGVAAYLSALLGALLWADTWMFSWWLVGAAAIGVIGAVVAVVVGWWRAGPLVRLRTRLGRAAIPLGLALLALAATPAVAAASLLRPARAQLSARVLELAADQRAHAPMPARVRALRDRAARLQEAAEDAQTRADSASAHEVALVSQRDRAQHAIDEAQDDVHRLRKKLDRAQADYDDLQQILDAPEPSGGDLGMGGDDLSAGDGYGPGLAPTTEDFGSGGGSIGFCNDGTLSDSIGLSGACSHHGGVAP